MGLIWLLRHAETTHTASGCYCGLCAAHLTPRGEAQAAALARTMAAHPLAAVYASALERAQATAAPLAAALGLTPVVVPALNELNYGAWEGLTRAEVAARDGAHFARWQADPAAVAPPGGETLRALAERVRPAFDAIAADHAGEEVAIIGHKCVNRVLLCLLLDLPPAHYLRIAQDPGAINRIIVEPHRTVIAAINDRCYWEGLGVRG
jgi:probable phosphoglycerate mutase